MTAENPTNRKVEWSMRNQSAPSLHLAFEDKNSSLGQPSPSFVQTFYQNFSSTPLQEITPVARALFRKLEVLKTLTLLLKDLPLSTLRLVF
jgi:hypothetical protein